MLTQLLKSAFTRRSPSAASLVERALALYDAGDFAAAERVLSDAIVQYPTDTAAITNLALVHIARGDAPRAVDSSDHAVADASQAGSGWSGRRNRCRFRSTDVFKGAADSRPSGRVPPAVATGHGSSLPST